MKFDPIIDLYKTMKVSVAVIQNNIYKFNWYYSYSYTKMSFGFINKIETNIESTVQALNQINERRLCHFSALITLNYNTF